MTLSRPVVIKVGGSLFDWPELRSALSAVLEEQETRVSSTDLAGRWWSCGRLRPHARPDLRTR